MSIELLNEIKQVVEPFNIDPYFAYAVAMVESNGKGYRNNGFPVIRFEKHVFIKYLKKNKAAQQLIRKAENLKGSGWDAYQAALKINPTYAKLATSFGMFQIMGFNHAVVGYETVDEFVTAMEESVENQTVAFCIFVMANHLQNAVRNKKFADFATKYNGPNYLMNNYDTKLEDAYNAALALESDEVVEEVKPKKRKGYTQTKE